MRERVEGQFLCDLYTVFRCKHRYALVQQRDQLIGILIHERVGIRLKFVGDPVPKFVRQRWGAGFRLLSNLKPKVGHGLRVLYGKRGSAGTFPGLWQVSRYIAKPEDYGATLVLRDPLAAYLGYLLEEPKERDRFRDGLAHFPLPPDSVIV